MSIVEKALTKLQGAAKLTPEVRSVRDFANGATKITAPVTEPVGDVAPVSTKLDARHRVEIDAAALQRAGLLPPQQDGLAMRNQFRRLKWPVLDQVAEMRRESRDCAGVVMVSSALPGEGKSFVSCNLALSIAREQSFRVVLIDADVAKGHLSEALSLRDKPGLTEYLSNNKLEVPDVLFATSIERLYILPAGRFIPHASELLSSVRMQQLLKTLVASGPETIVLMDTSPVLATNEAQVLSRFVSQILFIVRAEATPQPSVLEACKLLGREKISAVLNQANGALSGEPYHAQYGTYFNEKQ
ncbi:MAG TPA: hypothetical protein VET48_04610 [Steroidobacteraceae bacterium]|nr:hypothetical protein [Steroidobacteraceae bacterium]